jgi:hypothetical protein
MCPQVLQAGASLCMFLAAAFTASNPASAFTAVRCTLCAGNAAAFVLGAVT